MTNEEKAKEISSKYIYDRPVMHYEHGDVVYEDETFGEETEDAALDMAKWKDQQFKEYLEKKKRCLSLRSDWSAYENTIYNDCLAEIINELFKED